MNIKTSKKNSLIIEIENELKNKNLSINSSNLLKEFLSTLKSQTFGLYYDHFPELTDINKDYSFIINEKKSIIKDNSTNHQLFLGDNVKSMLWLKSINKKFNVIYADPPYNSLKSSMVYFDIMSPEQWCSFMEYRLTLMRDLLDEEGFIAISIGNAGQAQLKLLLDRVFGWENFVMHMPRRTKINNGATTKITRDHDYLYIYAKNWKKAYYLLYEPFLKQISSLEFMKDIYTNDRGYDDLKKHTNFPFDDPKPVELIKKMIEISPNKEISVLDPFAGSGTSFEAGIMFNLENKKQYCQVYGCQLEEKIIDPLWSQQFYDISDVTIARIKNTIKINHSVDGISIFEEKDYGTIKKNR